MQKLLSESEIAAVIAVAAAALRLMELGHDSYAMIEQVSSKALEQYGIRLRTTSLQGEVGKPRIRAVSLSMWNTGHAPCVVVSLLEALSGSSSVTPAGQQLNGGVCTIQVKRR